MARTRGIRKYNISEKRYKELFNFCLQYQEWQDELKFKTMEEDRQRILERKCELVEQTAIAAAAEYNIHGQLLKAVTRGLSYNYLKMRMDIPCGKDLYYEIRKKFYWILDTRRDKEP